MRFYLAHRVLAGVFVVAMGISSVSAQQEVSLGNGGQAARLPVALEGHCAVYLLRGNRWIKGSPAHHAVYDGQRYLFPSENERRAFLRAPSQFAPVLNGDSVVAYAETGQRVAGSIEHAMLQGGRLYLFQNRTERRHFTEDTKRYARMDLAYGGRCAVCRNNGGNVPGKPEFAARYRGIRYWFPSAKKQEQFLAEPDKYAVDSAVTAGPARGGASCACGSTQCGSCGTKNDAPNGGVKVQAKQQITVRGTTTCATCQYGVPPLGAKDTLGLAVETSDGKVYVVEDAHRLYPEIYKGRFGKLPVELNGQALQTQGKFTWVKPTSLKTRR